MFIAQWVMVELGQNDARAATGPVLSPISRGIDGTAI